jgi:hypothetical protein
MRRRIHIPLTLADRAIVAKWSAWMFTVTVLACSLVLMLPVLKRPLGDPVVVISAEHAVGSSCARWDGMAGEAIAHLVQNTQDADAQRLDDMHFRIRRARRSCQLGWNTVACQDYRAIVRSVAGIVDESTEAAWTCWPLAHHDRS